MRQIRISDITMKQAAEGFSLSFKEKIELAKLLDKLGVAVIELEGIENPRIDALRIKSIAAAVNGSIVAVPVQLNTDSVTQTWNALKEAKKPRLQVCAPVSSVQMEYLFHKKPDAMLKAIAETVKHAQSWRIRNLWRRMLPAVRLHSCTRLSRRPLPPVQRPLLCWILQER